MLDVWDHNKGNTMGKYIYKLRSHGAMKSLNIRPSALFHIPTKVDVFLNIRTTLVELTQTTLEYVQKYTISKMCGK
jgi:hypothetical protein